MRGFLCLTAFRLSYKKMRIWSTKLRRNASAWITLQIPKRKAIANLNVPMYFYGKQTNCSISKMIHTTVLYCTVTLNFCLFFRLRMLVLPVFMCT